MTEEVNATGDTRTPRTERIKEAVGTIKERAGGAYSQSRARAGDVAQRAGESVENAPMAVLVGGLAVGALVGDSVVPSSVGDDVVGALVGAAVGTSVGPVGAFVGEELDGKQRYSGLGPNSTPSSWPGHTSSHFAVAHVLHSPFVQLPS